MSHVERLAATLQDGSILVALVMLPFSIAAVELAIGGLLLGWLLRCGAVGVSFWTQAERRPLCLILLAYLIVCAASVAGSELPQHGLRALVTKWGEYALAFLLIAEAAAQRTRLRRWVVPAVVASALGVLFEAMMQELTGIGPLRGFPLTSYERMTGPYKDPVALASYLIVVIPLLAAVAATRTGWRRWGFGALVVGLLACLVRTETLAAWLSFGVALVVLLIRSPQARRLTAATVLLLGVVGVSYLSRTGRLQGALSPSDIGRADRWVMWQAAIRMIQDRPVLGHGLNTFMAKYLDYWVGGERQPRYAHNCYLQVAAEAGLLGLGMFLLFLWQLFARLWAALPATGRGGPPILLGLFTGLLAFAVHAAFDTNFYSVRQALLFWILAGVAVGWSLQPAEHRA